VVHDITEIVWLTFKYLEAPDSVFLVDEIPLSCQNEDLSGGGRIDGSTERCNVPSRRTRHIVDVVYVDDSNYTLPSTMVSRAGDDDS
jgi:hypothetical protein